MAATYVTMQELRDNLGIGTLYSDPVVEEVCQTAEDLLNSYLWFDSIPVVGAALANNYATLVLSSPGSYVAGQTITISGCGSTYNGSYTITATYPWSLGSATFPWFTFYPFNASYFPKGYSFIQYAKTAADKNYQLIVPYGKAAGVDTKTATYATTPAVREAAMMLAVTIWQARQVSNLGGVDPNFGPSPFAVGNSLMGRIRGLIAPYMGPRSMVG
jgi:hypothetical protein